ncbi:MAG: hypothetical protein DYG89_01990 [Caldilinea sp. CFX5]|nr:hypothetical protein [Caldilinea sp. CFX5]
MSVSQLYLSHAMLSHTKRKIVNPLFLLFSFILIATLIPAGVLYAAPAPALADSCDLVVEIIAAPHAVVDSNKPGVQGPQVVMLGARLTNQGAGAQENLQLAIGDGATPGTFPAGGSGALALLAKQTPTQWLPTLAPGQSETFYWAVTYPPTMNVSYPYVIWATTADGCTSSAKSEITTQRNLSTNANKLLPSGSLVQVAPGAVAPGAIVTVKITGFTLGTVGEGSKKNYESWIQPVGNPDFDPTCLRFVQSKVILNSISAVPFIDQFYFTGFQNYSRNPKDYVEYTFIALRSCSTPLQPYQRASSGTQDKYNGDYGVRGARIGVATQKAVALKMELTADKTTVNPGDTATLATTFAANGEFGAPESGSPAVITAVVPPNTVYSSGSANASVAATIEYSTDNGQTWQSTEPGDPATVTNLRWLLHKPVTSTAEKVTFAVVVKGEGASCVTGNATLGLFNSDTLIKDDTTVNCVVPTPTPTPTPTATPDSGVGSGGDGGLESGPLPGEPSAFIGGVGAQSDEATAAAANAVTLRQHKARLLEAMRIRLEDLMPTQGPAGTTAKPAVPVDVLAVTNAPEAKAIDFVDSTGRIRAVALGILSLGGPYEHDYGVCNRFKEYSFDTIEPRQLALPNGESGWFWHSHATKNDTLSEEALFLHIFVDETDKRFHIDSRWIKDGYPQSFDFDFDYVFNLQLWSNDLAKTQELLTGILTRLDQFENGTWRSVYHNQTMPTAATLFVTQSSYRADEVQLSVRNRTAAAQPVRLYGAWRDHPDRNTLQPFEYTLDLPADESKINLIFPGLLDATIYVESNGFTDKIYQGGGLWFPVKGEQENAPTMNLGQCRQLDDIDSTDLILAGCADLTTPPLGASDQAGIGRTLNPNGRSVDVSPYKALRFWAKGNGVPVRVVLETAGVTNNDYFQTTFTPDGQWRQYMLPLAQFAQSAATATLTGADVKAVIWMNAESAGRPLALSIDQVSFTNQGLLAELALPAATTTTAAQPLLVSGPSGIAQVTARYSVDGGATFQSVALNQQAQNDPAQVNFQGELPGQALGADVIYYLETTYTNGYVSRNPLDAPAGYYRYRVDDRAGLLIDDFAGGALRNRLNGGNGIFNHGTAGGRLLTYRANHELILDYDVRAADQFAGYFTNLSALDARAYTTLDLLVKGAAGGEQVRVGLRNSQHVEKYVSVGDLLPGGITDEWQWVQIPLRNFAPQMDLSALSSLSLFFANSDGNSQGRLYVKEMRFTTLGAPLVIDNFDDATLESNGQLMGYWTTAPNSTLDATLVAGDAQKATGKALQLQYTVGANGYAVWNSSLKQPAVQPESVLTFWVKGGMQTAPANLYLTSSNGRARVALKDYVSWNNQWQRVAIPMSAFSGQGFDLNALTGFQVAFEFAQGSGTLWLDQIQIGAPGAPQANQRLLYLRDVDEAAVALHLPYGGAWQAESDVPWLFVPNSGAGSTSLTVSSVNWDLAPGIYTGKVTIRAAGQTETITAQLTVTQTGTPAGRLYLPLLAR